VQKLLGKCGIDCREQLAAIDHLVAPLLSTKPVPKAVADPQAYVAEIVDGIAAGDFETTVLDLGLARIREERSAMPSLAICLQLLNSIASKIRFEREIATKRATRDVDVNDNGTRSADTRTSTLHAQLALRVGDTRFWAWTLNELRVERVEETKLIVSIPNHGLRRMIAKEFAQQIEIAGQAAFGTKIARVEIVVREAGQPTAPADRDRQLRSEMRALESWISGDRWDPQFGLEPKRQADAEARIAELEVKISEDFRASPPSNPGSAASNKQGVAACG
jgi:hypothetical protein